MVATDFLKLTTFFSTLDLTSGLAELADFFSAFLSDFAMVEDRGESLKKARETMRVNFGL